MLSEGHLRVGATGVVADQRRRAQVELLEGRGDQAGDAEGGEVGLRCHRGAVGAERQVEGEAAEVTVQAVDDLAPEVGVGQPAVAEEQDRTVTALEVIEHAVIELQLAGLTQQLRAPTMHPTHTWPSLARTLKTRSAKGLKIAAKSSGSLTCGAWPVSSSSS